MELFSSYHIVSLLCCDDDEMRRREPPFIGREEGLIPWNMLDPHMESTKPTSMYVELGQHLSTNVGHGGKCQPTEVGAKWARWPWLCPNAPIFGGSPLVIICDLAHRGVARSWGDLLRLWACSSHLWALVLHSSRPFLLGLCRMIFTLCFFVHS